MTYPIPTKAEQVRAVVFIGGFCLVTMGALGATVDLLNRQQQKRLRESSQERQL